MRLLLISFAVAASVYALAVVALSLAGRRAAAREMAAFLPNLALLFKGLIGDPRVPKGSKVLLLFGAAWIASPIDLIPEFIPFIGPLDDAVVAALILRHLMKSAGEEIMASYWRGDPSTLQRLLGLSGARSSSGED